MDGGSHLDTRVHAMIGVAAAFLALSWITVSLRVYVRAFLIRAFGWDDWLMLVTLMFFTLESVILIVLGWTETHHDLSNVVVLERLFHFLVLEIAFYICTSIFLKLSLAVFFLRVVIERWQRRAIYISVAIYTIYTVAYLFVSIWSCGNPSRVLENRLSGRCISWNILAPLNYIHGSLNAAVDWIFAIIPIFVIRKTRMSGRAKYSVYAILGLGTLGSVVSLVRLAYIPGLNPYGDNFFLDAVNPAITSIIEPGFGIVAISLATLRPLFRRMKNKTRYGYPPSEGKTNNRANFPIGEPTPPLEKLEGRSFTACETPDGIKTFRMTAVTSPEVAVSSVSPAAAFSGQKSFADKSSMSIHNGEHGQIWSQKPPSTWSCMESPQDLSHVSSQGDTRDEVWGDLHESKQRWRVRRQNGQDSTRMVPNLLLPDVDNSYGNKKG